MKVKHTIHKIPTFAIQLEKSIITIDLTRKLNAKWSHEIARGAIWLISEESE